MAKLTAPLFSFGASGQLGKALVYANWKGIDDVRTYVIPSNPRSSSQLTQRGYFTDALDLWHNLGLTADDIEAWNRDATASSRPQSGFNRFVGSYINIRVDGITGPNTAMGFNGGIVDSGAGQVDMTVEEDGSAAAVEFRWGYSPTSLINSAAGVEAANVWTAANVPVASNTTVYAQAIMKNVGGDPIGYTGIYRFGPTS